MNPTLLCWRKESHGRYVSIVPPLVHVSVSGCSSPVTPPRPPININAYASILISLQARPTCLCPLSPVMSLSHPSNSAPILYFRTKTDVSELPPRVRPRWCYTVTLPRRAVLCTHPSIPSHPRSPTDASQWQRPSTFQSPLRRWHAQWGRAAPLCLNVQCKRVMYAPIPQCCQVGDVRPRRSALAHASGSQRI